MTGPSVTRCGVTVTNSMETAPSSGGAGTLSISAARDCAWAASNGAAWIAITSSSNGQGDGSVTYRVAANNEPTTRRATIDVNTTAAAITQEAAACRYTVAPMATTVGASGGSMALQVQANAACGWTAASDASWIRIASGASGQGDGSVALAVDANSGPPRSARVNVAGSIVTVEQSSDAPVPPGCSYSIQPVGQTIAAAGGIGTIDVTANVATCAWTAAANAGWITITAGASGTGSGRVTFNVSTNAGASRSGAISVAGQTFTLTQAGASCSYSISPSNTAMASAGGATSVGVTTGGSCAWTSAANDSWITVTSGGSGTGPGTVSLAVANNPGAARSGTATIAAQTFTVTQAAAPCTYALSPASIDIPAAGGDRTTNVTAGGGCPWTAISNDPSWITITSGASGTGNGTVGWRADANGGPARSGTVTIGGQTLTVTQQPVACTYMIAPTSQTMVAGGGAGSVITVTAGSTCPWTATSNNSDWLTITNATPGMGNGSVSFSALANPGALRTGTLTIAGQTFTLTQDAPCTYAIDPQSQTITAAAGTGTVTVTASTSCPWSAVSSNPEWLTVSAGTPGTGNGQITFSASANTLGVARSATITIAGLSFTLTQTAQ